MDQQQPQTKSQKRNSNVTALRADLRIEYRPVAELVPNARNARTHLPTQVTEIAGSIRRFGFVNPVLISETGGIIAGHGRAMAAKQVGLATIPVILLRGVSEIEQKALALADNQIAVNSGWDADLLRSELDAIRSDGGSIDGLGFGTEELDALFADSVTSRVFEIDTRDVNDRFWISIRGPLAGQAAALKSLTEAMAAIPGVEVELGTVAIDG